jgi:hypothetical protein
MTPPPSPRRRKVRMLRPGGPPHDMTLLVRATPASIDEATVDIAEDALESAAVYEVQRHGGERVALYGVSVFARLPGVPPVEVLRRFASSPYYLEATAGAVRAAGFDVLPTGASPDHFDVLLIDGRPPDEPLLPLIDVRAAAERLVAVCGEARRNPAYPGGSHG